MLVLPLRLIAAAAFVLAFGELASAEQTVSVPENARLRVLANSLDEGAPGAEKAFWDEIAAKGAPLIEPIEGRPDRARVTFLWRDISAETHSVKLFSGPQIMSHYQQLDFIHLPKSSVWFLTLELPTGWRVGYMLAENADPKGFPNVSSDPLNPHHSDQDSSSPNSGTPQYSIFETPGAPVEHWFRRHDGLPKGSVELRTVQSRILGNDRTLDVYVPHGVRASEEPAGTLYLFDGEEYLRDMHVAEVLDNLIAERQIAPLNAVMIHEPPGDVRDRELSCDPKFTEFLAIELVAYIRRNFHVSEDPHQTLVGGVSLGGLEAAFAACKHPDVFGAVLAQSGSFWWQPDPAASDNGKPWMAEKYTTGPRLPVRFFLSVGRDEIVPSGANGVINTRQMRDALIGHGYEVHYAEIEGQHDPINWRLTFPDGLIALDPVR